MNKRTAGILCILLTLAAVAAAAWLLWPRAVIYGYDRPVSEAEAQKRDLLVSTAESWLGCKESDGTHKAIIDLYNAQDPLPQGYAVRYTDKWCAAFVSVAAIQCGITEILPTECGCQRQIELFKALGCWEEQDTYVPLPGDIIYYSSKGAGQAENTGWSDHVGIVVGTSGNKIQVIEGNFNGEVRYHYIKVDDPTIRGYGLPDYSE